MSEIQYKCSCGWAYNLSRNTKCPMCKSPPIIDLKFLVETLIEFCQRKAYKVKPKEAKMIIVKYRKKYGEFPLFDEMWNLADRVIKTSVDMRFDKKDKSKQAKAKAGQRAGKAKVKVGKVKDKADKIVSKQKDVAEKKKDKLRSKEERRKELEEKRKEEEEDKKFEVKETKPEKIKIPGKRKSKKADRDEKVGCIFCGFKNSIDSSFCDKCGKSI